MEYQAAFLSQKYLKNQLVQLSLSRWQAEWENSETGRLVYGIIPKISNNCTGPENASNSPLPIGPSPATLRDTDSILQTTADVEK
ncbi:hypothetical protein AVEN_157853-1 [Araneus ventricosus]|uniref:Uncharacterized protein n=1 Tax=Araneus ventricosus TaxID=182803 RepID=A0A4Y2E615_ARAVE|nr:hypothetical protein AVEN_157853-1 [Araneus ventricosus]